MQLAAGQSWIYRAPEGFAASRLLIGAIVTLQDGARIVCCMVTDAPRRLPDGCVDTVTVPFLPMTEQAFLDSVVGPDTVGAVDTSFVEALAAWQGDARGLTAFTVPFEGYLDQLIARQMQAIVAES